MGVYGEESRFKDMKLTVRDLEVSEDGTVTLTAAQIQVANFTTAGSTAISGNLQEVLEAIADLADPAG